MNRALNYASRGGPPTTSARAPQALTLQPHTNYKVGRAGAGYRVRPEAERAGGRAEPHGALLSYEDQSSSRQSVSPGARYCPYFGGLRARRILTGRRAEAFGQALRRASRQDQGRYPAAQATTGETRDRLEEVDRLIAEVNAAEPLAGVPPERRGSFRAAGALIRYAGAGPWASSEFGKVDTFFRLKFSRPLPVGALGQTETHSRLGFDHRQAVDVAVHPDSVEGQALLSHRRAQGISFIAIRCRIPGSATGAHIHIGPPSERSVLR